MVMQPDEVVPIPGSSHGRPVGTRVGDADPDEPVEVTVYLRRPGGPPPGGDRFSREELAERYGADPADIETLEGFVVASGLVVEAVDPACRAVRVSGRLGDLAGAFGASVARYRHPDGTVYRAVVGPLSAPAAVAAVVSSVLGLDSRPQALPHLRRPSPAAAPPVAYTPPEVAAAYSFPPGSDGSGCCIGLVELGGGYRDTDVTAYFAGLGLPAPEVTAVDVDGATNTPGVPGGPDAEVMLDIEVAGGVAPGARLAVYFAPNTDRGFIDAVTTAVNDTTNRPSVISISWGAPEGTWSAQALAQMEDTLVTAASLGVTVTVAAGDAGSSDGVDDGLPHVDFPASAPHALGCGGTTLELSGGMIASEVVWDDLASGGGATGGGVSTVFALPAWQDDAGVPPSPTGSAGRGVPDVAGDADPATGYEVLVDGRTEVVGGTSAVAPLWAGLVARLDQALGMDVGFLDPWLYATGLPGGTDPGITHEITSGTNGAYRAGPGWNPCSGLGTPDGTALIEALRASPPTGA